MKLEVPEETEALLRLCADKEQLYFSVGRLYNDQSTTGWFPHWIVISYLVSDWCILWNGVSQKLEIKCT